MHHHLEVIMPPTDKVEAALEQILSQFSEDNEENDRHSFWDFYVIGGRWSGAKLECAFDKERVEKFNLVLKERKVTVSGLQAGKQELSPATQIPMVDALWQEVFPESPVKVCPFFAHFNDKYENSDGFPDIMPLKDVPKELAAHRVIIAGPHWKEEGKLEVGYMIADQMWNGVLWVDAKWDGKVQSALDAHKERLKRGTGEYMEKHIPKDNWLVVTVDYHS